MSASKQLKFEFVLDSQSFQQVKRALGELTTEAQKFAKAMQGSGGGLFGGANVGSRNPSQAQTHGKMHAAGNPMGPIGSTLAQAVLKDVNAVRALSKSGADAMKVMKDATNQSLREQIAIVENLDKKIASLQSRYASLKGPDAKSRAAQNLLALTANRGEAGQALQSLHDLNYELSSGATPGRRGGILSLLTSDLTGGKLSGLAAGFKEGGIQGMAGAGMEAVFGASMGAIIARSIGAAVAGTIKIVNTSVAADQMGMNLYGNEGRAMRPFVDAYKSRDASLLGRARSIRDILSDKEGATQALSGVFGSDAEAQRWIQGAGQTLAGDLTGSGLTTLARDAKGAEALTALLNNAGDSKLYQLNRGRAEDYLESTRAGRLAASQIAGIGIFNGKDSYNRLMHGSNAVQITEEEYLQNLKGLGLKPIGLAPLSEEIKGVRIRKQKGLHELGFTDSQYFSGLLASQHGAGSGKFGFDIMSSTAAGWGQYGNVLTAAARLAGTDGARGLATLGLGGGISRGAGMQLAQGILGNGFDPRGTTGLAGVLGAFQGGYGHMLGKNADPALQFNAVNQYLAAMQTGSAFTTGVSSPFQLGMNVLGAVGAMPGSSMYHQDLLAQRFDMKQMMAGASGTLTGTMADVARLTGMTQDTFQKQIGTSFDGSLAMWADTGANDAVSLAMRKYRASGKSVKDFAKTASTDELKALGIGLSEVSGQDLEGSIGSMFALKGLGYKGAGGAAPMAGRPDDPERQKRELESQSARDASLVTMKELPNIANDLKAMKGVTEEQLTTLNGLLLVVARAAGVGTREDIATIKGSAALKAAATLLEGLNDLTPGSVPVKK